MNIENLEAFVFVVHLGSFNKAAEALFLSQPSVTARIRSLENEMNVKLFHRNGRYIQLTEGGKKLIPYAEKILQSYREATYKMNQHIALPEEVRIGCSISISNYLLPGLLESFRAKFPDTRVKILSYPSEQIMTRILEEEVDFGLVRTTTHPRMISKTMLSTSIGLYAAPDHPLALRKETIKTADLLDHEIIFYDHLSEEWLLLVKMFESMQMRPNIIFEVDNMETAKRLVEIGRGVCFLPEYSARSEILKKTLARIPVESEVDIHAKVSLMYLKEKDETAVLEFFSNKELYRKNIT
ncbi:LysR family transcriptional regulator [Paenibacillus piscarius]|uniref:LysR family transcriptional regulator n=1 Tax=Paenibacillus piscarius TaxID=1089681 RepID=UPI001EE94C7A|nr:LysR family transcriptional regulator [Paenibacillus piscarius]